MSRLIYVPQFRQKMRYQEFFLYEFENEFKKYFDEVITLGKDYLENYDDPMAISFSSNIKAGMFSSIEHSIFLETIQIREYMDMEIYDEDFLFMSDLSFPGFFTNVLYHKKPKNCFAYCHASSKNYLDYFEATTYSKFPCETAHSKLFKKIFVGSKYHQDKLGWKNTEVVGLPIPPFKTFREQKIYDIISVARPNSQKINKSIEDMVERDFGKIIRKESNSWEEYYKFLSQAKILLISSKEDTFNYSIMEAINNGTIVLAPNKLAFPELLPKEFLYNNYDELRIKIWQNLKNVEPIEKLLCHNLCENFYDNVINMMKEE